MNNNITTNQLTGSSGHSGLPAKFAIILCGGKGERVGSVIPKQFIEINGVPVLAYSMKTFAESDLSTRIILVLPENYMEYWEDLCKRLRSDRRTSRYCPEHITVSGGKTRTESVIKGIEAVKKELSHYNLHILEKELAAADNNVPGEDIEIAIHDGARPYVTADMLAEGWETCRKSGSAIPVVPVTDSLRKITDKDTGSTESVDRSSFLAVQTPQIFNLHLLLRAYSGITGDGEYTDDASVVERLVPVATYNGRYENVKITTKRDVELAEYLLRNR